MAMTLGTLIQQIRDRCDLENSQFVTNDEITSYINYSLGELYGLLVNAYGGDYFATNYIASVTAGGTSLLANFPDDLYKVMGVDLLLSPHPTTNKITLQPYNFNERNRANAMNMAGYATQYMTNYRYKLFNKTLQIQPPATGALQLQIWYVPQAPEFTIPASLGQTFDNNTNLNGWLEYVVVDVSIKIKTKEETDTSMFVRAKALLTERILNEAQNRDQGMPGTVSDVYATGSVTDVGWGAASDPSGWTY